MTREEAVKILEHSGDYVGLLPSEFLDTDDGLYEALDMAIEALKNSYTETMIVDGEETQIDPVSYEIGYTKGQIAEPQTDTISRHAAIKAINEINANDYCGRSGDEHNFYLALGVAIGTLVELPSADSKRKE